MKTKAIKARLYVSKLADEAARGFDLNFTAVLTLTRTQFTVIKKFIHILDKALFGQSIIIELHERKDATADNEPEYNLDEMFEDQAL